MPAEIVHTDYTRPSRRLFSRRLERTGLRQPSGRGDQSRRSASWWSATPSRCGARPAFEPSARARIDLASIDDPECRALLAKYDEAGIDVRVWNVTTDIGVPAFLCDIRDVPRASRAGCADFHGAGCHPDRAIALAAR